MDIKKPDKGGVKESLNESIRVFGPYMNLGLQMALPIIGFVFLGVWLDDKYSTSPLWVLVFSAVGLFASFYYFFKTVSQNKIESEGEPPKE